jgi:hypothetical protein
VPEADSGGSRARERGRRVVEARVSMPPSHPSGATIIISNRHTSAAKEEEENDHHINIWECTLHSGLAKIVG